MSLNLKERADLQRFKAKRLLNSAFNYGENFSNAAVDQAVDCIVAAAVLEISAILEREIKRKTDDLK